MAVSLFFVLWCFFFVPKYFSLNTFVIQRGLTPPPLPLDPSMSMQYLRESTEYDTL